MLLQKYQKMWKEEISMFSSPFIKIIIMVDKLVREVNIRYILVLNTINIFILLERRSASVKKL